MTISKFLSVLLLSLLCCVAYPQQTTLQGDIYIHNSRYNTGTLEKVPDAYVTAPYGGADNTDSEGKFELIFSGVGSGTSVAIKVEKEGYEVVNKKELLEVVIGRILPVKIFLAPKGQITQAQVELYNISVEALTERHNQIIAQLKSEATESQAAIKKLETQLNRTIADRFEAEDILNQQLEATRRRLPQFARQLATVNLDFASEMYREAYGYIKAGEIEKAIETLDEAVLDREAKEALSRILQYRADIRNLDTAYIYKEIELKELVKRQVLNARMLQETGEQQEALDNLQRLSSVLLRLTPEEQKQWVRLYLDAALLCQMHDERNKALYFLDRALEASKLEDLMSIKITNDMLKEEEAYPYLQLIQATYQGKY